MQVLPGQTIVCWFSRGAASAVAAKLTIEKYGSICTVRVVNNPVQEEHPDSLRFLKDCERWLGVPIELCTNPEWPTCSAQDVWEKRRYMSGTKGAPCTDELKKLARKNWELNNHFDHMVLGFTADEEKKRKRYSKFIQRERANVLPILIERNITKAQCMRVIRKAGIDLPALYKEGYPNANCIGCVKAASPQYWNLVRRTYPDIFEQRAKLSREIGCRLVELYGKKVKVRIFLDELDPNEKRGAPLKSFDAECGIFCEEK